MNQFHLIASQVELNAWLIRRNKVTRNQVVSEMGC